MSLEELLNHAQQCVCLTPNIEASRCSPNSIKLEVDVAATMYSNCNSKFEIDFCVDRLPLAGLQVMDPRLVRIAPGSRNECHRHAHESIFIVVAGQAELRLGDELLYLNTGDVDCISRWVVHQAFNTSSHEELLILAITDFGLTSAVLGDYDHRTRLSVGGIDAFAVAGSNNLQTP
jgi:uncharacterized cupin superfamily protein